MVDLGSEFIRMPTRVDLSKRILFFAREYLDAETLCFMFMFEEGL